LLEVRCETDFVAKSDDFKNLCHDLALHIAAMAPSVLKPSDISRSVLEKEKEIYEEQLKEQKKAKELIRKIVDAKIEKYKKETSLLEQAFVKDPDKSVQDLINEVIAKLGENIFVERFQRFEI